MCVHTVGTVAWIVVIAIQGEPAFVEAKVYIIWGVPFRKNLRIIFRKGKAQQITRFQNCQSPIIKCREIKGNVNKHVMTYLLHNVLPSTFLTACSLITSLYDNSFVIRLMVY